MSFSVSFAVFGFVIEKLTLEHEEGNTKSQYKTTPEYQGINLQSSAIVTKNLKRDGTL